MLVPESRVPPRNRAMTTLAVARVEEWIAEAQRNRPEMAILGVEQRKTRIDQKLARNDSLPRLDLTGSVARDLGNGAASLGQTDFAIGVRFELPLLRRKARGNARAARAKLARLRAKERGLRDRVAAEVRMLVRLEQLAQTRWRLADRRLGTTRRLATAERTRLEQGASDMVTVNLRELAVASAATEAIEARLEVRKVRADLLLARGTSTLGR
jgi:outer membrane protein TolC